MVDLSSYCLIHVRYFNRDACRFSKMGPEWGLPANFHNLLHVARNELHCVTSPTVAQKIFVSIVTGRVFCSTARIYGPYVRVSKMHPYIRAVSTARIYERWVRHTTRIYWPYSRKALRTMLFCIVWAVYTGRIHGWPVRTTRTYVCRKYIASYTPRKYVCQKCKYGPYIRVLGTHYPHIELLFCTGRIYGPYIRVTGTHYP